MEHRRKDMPLPNMNDYEVIQKCCCCIRADIGINVSVLLSLGTIIVGIFYLYRGDPATLYGASQEVVDEVTKNLNDEEYEFWVAMQPVIWWGYIILCNINMIAIGRWLFNDTYGSRMCIAFTNFLLSLFTIWNIVLGFLGFYYATPRVGMLIVYGHVTVIAYLFAKEIQHCEDIVKPDQPQNPLPVHELLRKTNNWDNFMNRTWYCISFNDQNHDMVCFFEEYSWVDKAKGTAGNDTVTQARGQPKITYPTWRTWAQTNGVFKMEMKQDVPCGCYFNMPGTLDCRFLMFPENDSQEEFWVQHGMYGPIDMAAIWCQNPFVSDEIYQKTLKKLKEEHNFDGYQGKFKQKKIDYTGYVIGSNGEKFRNPGFSNTPNNV